MIVEKNIKPYLEKYFYIKIKEMSNSYGPYYELQLYFYNKNIDNYYISKDWFKYDLQKLRNILINEMLLGKKYPVEYYGLDLHKNLSIIKFMFREINLEILDI